MSPIQKINISETAEPESQGIGPDSGQLPSVDRPQLLQKENLVSLDKPQPAESSTSKINSIGRSRRSYRAGTESIAIGLRAMPTLRSKLTGSIEEGAFQTLANVIEMLWSGENERGEATRKQRFEGRDDFLSDAPNADAPNTTSFGQLVTQIVGGVKAGVTSASPTVVKQSLPLATASITVPETRDLDRKHQPSEAAVIPSQGPSSPQQGIRNQGEQHGDRREHGHETSLTPLSAGEGAKTDSTEVDDGTRPDLPRSRATIKANQEAADSGSDMGYPSEAEVRTPNGHAATSDSNPDERLQQDLLVQARTAIRRVVSEGGPAALFSVQSQLEAALRTAGANEATIETVRRELLADAGNEVDDLVVDDDEDLAQRSVMSLRAKRGDVDAISGFVSGPMVKAMRDLVSAKRSFNAEQQADLMIHVFASEPMYANADPSKPRLTLAFATLLTEMRDRLWLEMGVKGPQALGEPTLRTLTNLVSWMAQAQTRHQNNQLAWCADLALPIVEAALSQEKDTTRIDRILFQMSNNLAGWLGDLLDAKDEDKLQESLGQQINDMHALATISYLRSGNFTSRNQRAQQLIDVLTGSESGAAADRDSGVAEQRARALLFMNNIPSAWRYLGDVFSQELKDLPLAKQAPRLSTAVLAALSSVFRAEFNPPTDADELSSALFNLGVDANLMRRSLDEFSGASAIRLLANGLGFWWAISKGRNMSHALNELHGGDCAVNLFGTLADEELQSFLAERDIAQLCKQLLADQIDIATALKHENNLGRMLGSYRRLFGENYQGAKVDGPRSAIQAYTPLSSVSWLEQVLKLLNQFAVWHGKRIGQEKLNGFPGLVDSNEVGKDFPVALARAVGWAFNQLKFKLPGQRDQTGLQVFSQLRERWLSVTDTLLQLSSRNAEQRKATADHFKQKLKFRLEDWNIEDQPFIHALSSATIPNRQIWQTLSDAKTVKEFLGRAELLRP